MPRLALSLAVIALALGPLSVAFADEAPREFKLRYAVVLDDAELFYAEVTCRTDRRCELVDHKDPDISLSISGDSGRNLPHMLFAHCDPECVLSPERPSIELRDTRQLIKIELSQGKSPGHDAVLLRRHRMGDIYIVY